MNSFIGPEASGDPITTLVEQDKLTLSHDVGCGGAFPTPSRSPWTCSVTSATPIKP